MAMPRQTVRTPAGLINHVLDRGLGRQKRMLPINHRCTRVLLIAAASAYHGLGVGWILLIVCHLHFHGFSRAPSNMSGELVDTLATCIVLLLCAWWMALLWLFRYRGASAWFVAVVSIPIAGWFRFVRDVNWPAGACSTCGYDLRGSPDRCPECGRAGDQQECSRG